MADYTLVSLFDDQQAVEMVTCPICKKPFFKRDRRMRTCSPVCNSAVQNRKRSSYTEEGKKFCRPCNTTRPFAEFPGTPDRSSACNFCLKLKADGKKRCATCHEIKSRDDFHSRKNKDGRESRCKDCSSAASKAYNSQPEVKERTRNRHYLTRFNITAAQYDAMVAERNGLCDICCQSPSGRRPVLAVDHDHQCCPGDLTCGSCIRGLLCYSCNTALGAIRDNPKLALGLVDYLRRYTAT